MNKLFFILILSFFSLGAISATKEVVLTKNNVVTISGVVDDFSMSKASNELVQLNKILEPNAPIYLFLDTPGGYVTEGLALILFLKSFDRTIHCVVKFAASMGFQITENCPGQRLMIPYGILMAHPMSGGTRGEIFADGKGSAQNRLNLWANITKQMDQAVVDRTEGFLTLEKLQSLYDNELWMLYSDAKKLHLIDEEVIAKCDQELMESVATHSVDFPMFGVTVSYKQSDCPLNSNIYDIKFSPMTELGKIEDNQRRAATQFYTRFDKKPVMLF